jgi:diadenosine tetraphosphate (Ap4A) HIT family hydrolase
MFENKLLKIEVEESEIPWLKIFIKREVKELSDCTREEKQMLFEFLDVIEKEMLLYFTPDKINIASFGNYLPQVHFHIMARFKTDSFFPEPMWGKKQRESKLQLTKFDIFYNQLKQLLHRLS